MAFNLVSYGGHWELGFDLIGTRAYYFARHSDWPSTLTSRTVATYSDSLVRLLDRILEIEVARSGHCEEMCISLMHFSMWGE